MSEPGKFISYTINASADVATAEQGHAPQVTAAAAGFVSSVKDWEKAALVGDLEAASAAKVLVAQYADQLEGLGQAKAVRVKYAGGAVDPVPQPGVSKESRKLS